MFQGSVFVYFHGFELQAPSKAPLPQENKCRHLKDQLVVGVLALPVQTQRCGDLASERVNNERRTICP